MLDEIGVRHGLLGAVIVWSMVAAAHALVPGLFALLTADVLARVHQAPSRCVAASPQQHSPSPTSSRD